MKTLPLHQVGFCVLISGVRFSATDLGNDRGKSPISGNLRCLRARFTLSDVTASNDRALYHDAASRGGVDPDVWKVEGLDRQEDCAAVVGQARQGDRDGVGIIVLGRGETEAHVERWLEVAAQVPGYIGFAVGRTAWWDPLVDLRDGKTSRDQSARDIATAFRRLVDYWVEHAG